MKTNFKKSLKPVLVWEGGYVNHPKDPGGPTNKGITQEVYNAYRRNQGKPTQSVSKISDSEVEAIYNVQYWEMVGGDDLPAGVDLAVFDYAVNSGTARAIRSLQKCVGVAQDGQIGEVTLQRVSEVDALSLISSICNERLSFVKKLRTWSTFGKGWQRRIMGDQPGVQDGDKGIIDIASRMAKSEPLPPLPKAEANGKADPVDVKIEATPEGAAGGTGVIGAGGVAAAKVGVGAWIGNQMINLGEFAGFTKDQIEPLVQYSSYIGYAFIGLTVLGAVGVVAVRLKNQKEGSAV